MSVELVCAVVECKLEAQNSWSWKMWNPIGQYRFGCLVSIVAVGIEVVLNAVCEFIDSH